MPETFAQMGFAAVVTASSATPETDGYVGTFGVLPYHVHPTATPLQWAALEAAIAANAVTVNPYVAPVPPPPLTMAQQAAAIPSVPSWKIQEVLFAQASPTNVGKTMLDDADTVIASQSKGVQIAWNGGADVAYTSPALAAVCSALSITQASFDAMWVQASTVSL
jgi:hypothetical protein